MLGSAPSCGVQTAAGRSSSLPRGAVTVSWQRLTSTMSFDKGKRRGDQNQSRRRKSRGAVGENSVGVRKLFALFRPDLVSCRKSGARRHDSNACALHTITRAPHITVDAGHSTKLGMPAAKQWEPLRSIREQDSSDRLSFLQSAPSRETFSYLARPERTSHIRSRAAKTSCKHPLRCEDRETREL